MYVGIDMHTRTCKTSPSRQGPWYITRFHVRCDEVEKRNAIVHEKQSKSHEVEEESVMFVENAL